MFKTSLFLLSYFSNAYVVAVVTKHTNSGRITTAKKQPNKAKMPGSKYFEGEYLTEETILLAALLENCGANATNPRAIPKDKSIKNSDVVHYYTRNARIVYPDSLTSTNMIILNVVIYHEIFKRYDKSNVYVGIPQMFAR